ncbi:MULTISPECIES: hypothetical protein [unclassified Streptomyces]|uniref:hypothetical protein n=1 Tax=unclassified Streptomyces TaxID=2593676 RepID=UPI002DD97C4D|nr:hypothetical protein [Streptomyces sp. NBC_01445]WSE11038.1 hypothetical protein OG574_02810 [Streptomyces sp. NBC_01445]
MAAVLAVDVGKTGCRAAVWTAGSVEPHETCEAHGAPGLAQPDGVPLAEKAVLTAGRAALDRAGVRIPDAVCVGAAGSGHLAIGGP